MKGCRIMDQIKIGRFIADCRKQNKLTQTELADKLGITDKAVSKWERGIAMPDSSIMLEVCEILGVSINELLSGERLSAENYVHKAEEKLLSIQQEKERSDKKLLRLEIIWSCFSLLAFFVMTLIGAFLLENTLHTAYGIILICVGVITILATAFICLRIEQTVGYYECSNCQTKHVPSYGKVLIAPHVNRTRLMKCPHCKKICWHKKVLK